MTSLNKLLLGSETNIGKRNMIWNMVGSGVYSLTSMLIGIVVTRILGEDLGGIFFFAFTTFGQQMFTVAYFGMRPVQITDVQEHYSFGDYRRFRIYTSSAAMLGGLLYMLLLVEEPVKKAVVLLMVCYKVIDGFADVYESEFQRNGKLYLTGKSNTFRTLLSVGAFLAALVLTRNLIWSCVIAVAAQLAGFCLFNQSLLGALSGIDRSVKKGSGRALFHAAKWLFASTFLDLYIFSAAKYAIDTYMEPSASTYFGTIFIPTSVINLAAGFIIRPFLSSMSLCWEQKRFEDFWKVIRMIIYAILGFTVLGLGAAYLLGIPVLSLLLGAKAGAGLEPYRAALLINILGGSFYAVSNLLYYVLVIMKEQRYIFMVYMIGSLGAVLLAPRLVVTYGVNGGAVSYLLLMILLTALFAGAVVGRYQRVRKSHGK